ncbi:hypothetical protein [Bradyrhizobium sp. 41S5]|nr:hypothetical protein [Bradyrhizobium sp. 41S5]
MAKAAQSKDLRKAFTKHLREQPDRADRIRAPSTCPHRA